MIRTQRRPDIDQTTVATAVAEGFGLRGVLSPLPGERDRNFLFRDDDGRSWVVKVTSPEEPDAQLVFESRLIEMLTESPAPGTGRAWEATRTAPLLPVPSLRPTRMGDAILRWPSPEGDPWRIRVLSHLPGRVFADVRPHTSALLMDLGRRVAELTLRLADVDMEHPTRDAFVWALENAGEVMEDGRATLPLERRDLVDAAATGFREVEARLHALPRQLIHGDLNDHNLLVDDDGRISGVLDFGDAHRAPAVFDLAIAVAYAVLDQADPLQAAAHMVAGYHAVRPLDDLELDVLFPLVRARLGASVMVAASRRADSDDVDDYLLVSERPAWRVLEETSGVHPHFARGVFRYACGLEPCPRAPQLVAWMHDHADSAPVMDVPPEPRQTLVLDLSVASPSVTGRDTDDTEAFTRRVFQEITRAGATLGVGRYREPRGLYLTDAFAGRPAEMPERRTVHMGIDLFDRAGAAVRAPLDAVVVSAHDNAGRLDYGPTVILEHDTPHGPFWTLYGHLERQSIAALAAGDTVARGQPFARVGPYPENGDWPPHLHFQIMTDRLGMAHDFPGVAAPREVEVWGSFSPDPNLLLRLPHETTWRPPSDLQTRRQRLLGPSLSLSYPEPIHAVRGRGASLFDVMGREYLDGVNNVAHVGHEHPRVVEAGRRQMGVLNTNTRYLHETVLAYAEQLTALLPDPLSVCFFVNSGSEANELALRMARTVSGGRGVVALEGGYHGNTQGLVDVSHYKFSHAGGSGPPAWVRAAAMPEDYRGRYRRDDPERAGKYAGHVADACAELSDAGYPPAAFLAETLLSCGGQVELPPGYLDAAYAHARAAGALCIADEVQVGFGRVGSHMWGFETQGVVPDIVTLGKPIGNGHPLGAVVTTRAIADRFANGMEYFSTYGGNPVSAAIGLEVLDVLRDEALQEHAFDVGGALKGALTRLMERHAAIGDVRGLGLFLGVEFVADRDARNPAPAQARYAVARMKEHGILLSTDGPDDNVIKIKPPMVFSSGDAERVVATLDRVLDEDSVGNAKR